MLYWRQKTKGGGRRARIRNEKVIAESLKRRMLRHNLTDITVTDLCTDAEINRRTFYRHFTDKYQLVTWIYENGFQKAIGDDEPGLFDLFGRVCTYLYADRAFYARALTFTGQNSFRDFLCGRLHPYLQKDFPTFFQSADRGVHVREDVERRHRHRAKLARAAGLPTAGGVRAVGAEPVAEHYGALERPRRCVGAHSRPQKRISEANSHRTPVLWLFLWRKLFYAYLTP